VDQSRSKRRIVVPSSLHDFVVTGAGLISRIA
jgi:hypothetical protein